jgi:hypothetical protein
VGGRKKGSPRKGAEKRRRKAKLKRQKARSQPALGAVKLAPRVARPPSTWASPMMPLVPDMPPPAETTWEAFRPEVEAWIESAHGYYKFEATEINSSFGPAYRLLADGGDDLDWVVEVGVRLDEGSERGVPWHSCCNPSVGDPWGADESDGPL